jgi:hypothetical protein
VGVTCIERGSHDDGLTRQRYAKALNRHQEGDGEVPVVDDGMGPYYAGSVNAHPAGRATPDTVRARDPGQYR